jgi:undecaprenyl pyrophosphate phosphatase UppP
MLKCRRSARLTGFERISRREFSFEIVDLRSNAAISRECYDGVVFNFGNPQTPGQWIGHIVGAIIALFLIWWLLRLFVL